MTTGTNLDKWIDEALDKMGLDTDEERAKAKQILSLVLTLAMLNAGGDWTKVCKFISQANQGIGLLLALACPNYVSAE